MVQSSQQIMIVEKVESSAGYIEIKVDNEEIVNKYDIILHIINPKEILEVVESLEATFKILDLNDKNPLIQKEISTIKSKIYTIIPHRYKRGLINIVGNTFSWLFGTMDNNDKQNIENHFLNIDYNNNKIIENMNQQIKINENFNKTFFQIKNIIQTDRVKILERLNEIEIWNKKALAEGLFLEQVFKLNIIKEQVEHIQENIASARLGILHPNILTKDEIELYKIDFKKLQNIRLGVAKYEDNLIIFAIKIPSQTITLNKNIIVPITTVSNKELDTQREYIIRYNSKTYTFEENRPLYELKLSKNCIFIKNCKYITNSEQEIIKLDDNMLILKNFKNGKLNSTCDERNIKLNGNYFITFNNCSIFINNEIFSNKEFLYKHKFVLPKDEIYVNTSNKITFEDIILNQENNIQNIKELRNHKIVNYSLSTFIILIIIFVIIFVYNVSKKQNKIRVKINNQIQENLKSKEGGVISVNESPNDNIVKFHIYPPSFDKVKEILDE